MIIRSRAPLRISFGGGGTDVSPYPEMFGGAVFSTTIDRYAYVSIKPNKENTIRIISQDYDLLEIYQNVVDIKKTGKLNLIKHALKFYDFDTLGVDIILDVDAPPGSGLGSSSALIVALIGAINQFRNIPNDPLIVSENAYKIEREEAGIKGGKQDQYSATFGGFNFIEFSKNNVSVTPQLLSKNITNELLSSMVICDTGVTRLSAKILERQINSYVKSNLKVIDNLNHIKKLSFDMCSTLKQGKILELGELLNQHWNLKKQLDDKISNDDVDQLYDFASSNGSIGGKLLGAGGGGHFLFICKPEERSLLVKKLVASGRTVLKFNFDSDGLSTWKTDGNTIVS